MFVDQTLHKSNFLLCQIPLFFYGSLALFILVCINGALSQDFIVHFADRQLHVLDLFFFSRMGAVWMLIFFKLFLENHRSKVSKIKSAFSSIIRVHKSLAYFAPCTYTYRILTSFIVALLGSIFKSLNDFIVCDNYLYVDILLLICLYYNSANHNNNVSKFVYNKIDWLLNFYSMYMNM